MFHQCGIQKEEKLPEILIFQLKEGDVAAYNPADEQLFELVNRVLPEEDIGSSSILLLIKNRFLCAAFLHASEGVNLMLLLKMTPDSRSAVDDKQFLLVLADHTLVAVIHFFFITTSNILEAILPDM